MTLLLTLLLALLNPSEPFRAPQNLSEPLEPSSARTPAEERLFRSEAVERQIAEIVSQLTNPKLA